MSDAVARARELFTSGMFCAESVLQAVAESQGCASPLIPRIATGLCAGCSRTGNLCGALTGGMLAISLVHGRDCPDDSRDACYSRVQALANAFQETFGAVNCAELLGYRLDDEEQLRKVRELGLIQSRCLGFTEQTVRLVLDLL